VRNSIPERNNGSVQPQTNPVTPLPNEVLDNAAVNLTQADINNIISQLDERDLETLADIRQLPLVGLDEAIDDLPNADDLSPEDRQRLREAVRNGDPNAVRELLDDEAEASAAGRDLVDRATAVQLVDDAVATITDGTLNGGDLAALIDGAQLFPPAVQADVLNDFGQIAANQQVVLWLLDTQPGVVDVPFGFDLPIALVPGLPQDLLLPLAGGPVLAGMGAPGDAILLGTGNPWQVAGMPVALPGAESADAVEEGYADGIAVIENTADETVNYNIDNQPFSLAAEYEQTLSGDDSWIIEFDRGGAQGMAKYSLKPGYYRFKATDHGWDLYKAAFTCSLDNSGNEFSFNYVLDDQQQVLAPGEIHDLTGDMPPVITFDNGRGNEKKIKLESGTYRVAIGSDQALDIFAAAAVSDSAKKSVTSSVRPAAKQAATLPAGFKLFDPVDALMDVKQAKSLPKEFTLFRSAAEELAQNDNKTN
jgi:hypothetical protein